MRCNHQKGMYMAFCGRRIIQKGCAKRVRRDRPRVIRRIGVAHPAVAPKPTGKCWIVSFNPMCITARGRRAVKSHGVKPFVDSSCRREPDLEAAYPTITEICRPGKFAFKLAAGDEVVYVSTKDCFGSKLPHHRYVARLVVLKVIVGHSRAAAFYRSYTKILPSNCIVPNNPPMDWRFVGGEILKLTARAMKRRVSIADKYYSYLAKRFPVFVICKAIYMNLDDPRQIFNVDWVSNFGRVPGTQNPTSFASHVVHAFESAIISKSAPPAYPQ